MGARLGKLFERSQEIRIILSGFNYAGKTTILYMLKLGEVVTTIPTIGFNVESFKWRNNKFTVWDLGGSDKMRPLFCNYFANCQALIYVVDSNDAEIFSDVNKEIHLFAGNDHLRDSLILILANKQDMPSAKSPLVMIEALELHKLKQQWYIIPTVATTGDGLTDGLEWISNTLNGHHKPENDSTEILNEENPKPASDYLLSCGNVWNVFRSLIACSKNFERIEASSI